MSNLYTCSIDYTNIPPLISPPTEFQTSSVVYDILTDSYIDSGSVWIDLQEIINYANIDNHFFLKYADYASPHLQHYYYGLSETKQYYIQNIYLQFTRLQPTYIKNVPLSRQVTARASVFANLQKTDFTATEPDKFKWFMRATDKNTDKYFYWSSENIKSSYREKQQKENSKEIIGYLFIKGGELLSSYSMLFEYQDPLVVGPLSNNISQSTPSPDDGVYMTGSITVLPDGTVGLGSDRQIYLQKANMINQNKYKSVYHNRGKELDKNRYTYWRSTELSNKDTTYNTIQETRETLGSNYEK